MEKCRLCNADTNEIILLHDKQKKYYKCTDCYYIFVGKSHLLDSESEKKRYELHKNHKNDQGYISFLSKVINPLLESIKTNMIGLDYGCGPAPVVSEILKENKIHCEYYDPYFYPKDIPDEKYDYIISTECFEHFYYPSKEINIINSHIKKDGYLAIMTGFWNESILSREWYYAMDPTHTGFYCQRTIDYIAHNWNYRIIYNDLKSVVILQKN